MKAIELYNKGFKVQEMNKDTIAIADAQALPLVEGEIDLIVTDPPYGISYKSGKQSSDTRGAKNRYSVRDEYFQPIVGDSGVINWMAEGYRVLKEGGACYVFAHATTVDEVAANLSNVGFVIKNRIVLAKSNHGMGDLKGSYAPKYELLLFCTKGRHILVFPEGRKADIWQVPVLHSKRVRLHPNQKPTAWMLPAIINSSSVGDTVLDFFCGSGSTLVAAKESNRHYLGFDIDPRQVSIAQQRLSKI